MDLLDYLRDVFSEDIISVPLDLPAGIPHYLRHGYIIRKVVWGRQECLVAAPREGINLQSMKKQIRQIEQLAGIPAALELPRLTAMQRSNLLQNRIPFVSAGRQVYFPFWGCVFTEKYEQKQEPRTSFAPATQAVFLYLQYHADETLTLSQIADSLKVSNTSLTRAVRELGDLTEVRKVGQAKSIKAAEGMMQRGYSRLKTPIDKRVYVRSKPPINRIGGILALSSMSMLAANDRDGCYVVGRREQSLIPQDIISEEEFLDFGGYEIEVWAYDPLPNSSNPNLVDDLSLLLSLAEYPDERVQMALDKIREKYRLAVDV